MNASHRRADTGETLIEVVISLLMFGLAGAGILGAVSSSSLLSSDHRKLAVSDIALKVVSEAVKEAAYVPAAGDGAYSAAGGAAPAGYTAVVGPVRCWPGGAALSYSVDGFQPCASGDEGLQLVTVKVQSADGRAVETTQVMKRRAP